MSTARGARTLRLGTYGSAVRQSLPEVERGQSPLPYCLELGCRSLSWTREDHSDLFVDTARLSAHPNDSVEPGQPLVDVMGEKDQREAGLPTENAELSSCRRHSTRATL
jgi:hypothetical protein